MPPKRQSRKSTSVKTSKPKHPPIEEKDDDTPLQSNVEDDSMESPHEIDFSTHSDGDDNPTDDARKA